MSLTAVLAELDGTGVPLCYLFVGTTNSNQVSKSADPGATTCILKQFLQPLKNAGYDPIFFDCDKDKAEISAIRQAGLMFQCNFVTGMQRELFGRTQVVLKRH